MRLIAKTKSGSRYIFEESEGRTRVNCNYRAEGYLIGEVEIELGKPMELIMHKLSNYNYHEEMDETFVKTAKVIAITIC